MRRRTILATAAAAMAAPSIVRAQSATTLKFVPYADLVLLDPAVSSFVTRNHVLMVFDTLFGVDEAGRVQPQMLAGSTTAPDGLTWTLTLRDGLKFHDNTPVLARDVVASLRRWWVQDAFGQALALATDELSAPDDRTIVFRLKRKFPLLPDALAHPTNTMAAIMPERLAATPASTRLTEMIGSGPFRYVANERIPGARNVYARFDGYVPRTDAPSFTAGARVAYFDRVEWLTTPDPATQVAALQNGEVDYVEQPLMDLVPQLRANKTVKVEVVETKGLIGFLRFNQLFPPFNNPAIRRAMLGAVSKEDVVTTVVGTDAKMYRTGVGFFCPGTPMASEVGMEALNTPRDMTKVKAALEAAGYRNERVVLLAATDFPVLKSMADVTADMMSRAGLNVDYQATDWGSVVARRGKKEPVEQGGWSAFCTAWAGTDHANPAGHLSLRTNGNAAWFGWPSDTTIESLRDQWFVADGVPAQAAICADIQKAAFDNVPYIPMGQYLQPTAYRDSLTGMLSGFALFWNVRRA